MRRGNTGRRIIGQWLEPRQLLAGLAPVITEFMAANTQTLRDEDGEFSDWIEIHNPTDQTLSLQGWALTDDANDRNQWRFPQVELPGRGYRIVFASGKDRRDPAGALHTNFRLRREGEFLGLVDPSGVVVQSFGDAYPLQQRDVSYGLTAEQVPLVTDQTSSRLRVPTEADSPLSRLWPEPGFDDSSWQAALAGVGYDRRMGIPNVGFESGDLSDWEAIGDVQTVTSSFGFSPTDGAQQAIARTTENSPVRFAVESFLGLPRSALDQLTDQIVTRGAAVKRQITVNADTQIQFDWNFLTNESAATGSNDFAFVTLVPGPGALPLADALTPDQLRPSQSRFASETGYRTFQHTFAEAGTYTLGIGVVHVNNRFVDSAVAIDNLLIGGVGSAGHTLRDLITTNVESQLFQKNSSLWLRYPFRVEDLSQVKSVALQVRYDDAFVAYLNGVEIARRNTVGEPTWDTRASQARDDNAARSFEDIAIRQADLLSPGQNVLAIQGISERPDDANLLVQIRLIAVGDVVSQPGFLPRVTPGGPNLSDNFDLVAPVEFSTAHGFFHEPFTLVLSTATPGATIRYTTDGSDPGAPGRGIEYTGPIAIDHTTTIRATALRQGALAPRPVTQTYIFIEDVVRQSEQSALAAGFPPRWGPAPADYAMDQRVIGRNGTDLFGGVYATTIRQDLLAIPTVSIVMDQNDLFGPQGIYANPQERGPEWERPTSVELIYPDGRSGFQIDAGIRVQGGVSRFIASKQSLRLIFRDQYGAAKLDFPLFAADATTQFDSITLRSSSGEHVIPVHLGNLNGLHFLRDEFMRRSQLATGNPSPHGTFVHLYINGLYWGLYNPVERIDGQFAANYFGGAKDEYDVLNAGDFLSEGITAVDGSLDAWNQLVQLANQVGQAPDQQAKTAAYLRLAGRNPDGSRNPDWEVYLDTRNFIDYLVTQLYGGNWDWPQRNYAMLRRRGPDSTGFKFLVWDAEFTLDFGMLRDIRQLPLDGPGAILRPLLSSEAFRVDFSDRVQQHFSPGGAFYVNPANRDWDPNAPQDNVPADRYAQLVDEIDEAIVAESARWGDEKAQRATLFTRDEQWLNAVNFNLTALLPVWSQTVLNSLRAQDVYRDAPSISLPAGSVPAGSRVEMQAASGEVYYTLDGSDPRLPDGSVSPSALRYRSPIAINRDTEIRARSLNGTQWSAAGSAVYLVDAVRATATNLRVSEIQYRPHPPLTGLGEPDLDNDEFEFVELVNISERRIDMTGVRFVDANDQGVVFEFGPQALDPQERIVVPKNRQAFLARYGQNPRLARGTDDQPTNWVFTGQLSNDGEQLTLVSARGAVIQQFAYDDDPRRWPDRADGQGSSLEVVDPRGNYSDPRNFRASIEFGGSPGQPGAPPDRGIVVNEVLANTQPPLIDQIELLNTSPASIDLGGWYITDSMDEPFRYRIPNGTTIGAGQYLVIGGNELAFGLSGSSGDQVLVIESSPDGRPLRFADHVTFGASEQGVALGRWPAGRGRLFPMTARTFGQTNSGPIVPDVVVSEVYFGAEDPDGVGELRPEDVEFVELTNRSEAAVDLSGWSIDGDLSFRVADGLRLDPGESVVIVGFDPRDDPLRRAVAFRFLHRIDATIPLLGPATGSLHDDFGLVQLLRPDPQAGGDPPSAPAVLVDEVLYDSRAPWPTDTVTTGRTLNRRQLADFGNLAQSWRSDTSSPGSYRPDDVLRGDINRDGRVDDRDIDRLCASLRTRDLRSELDLNGSGIVDLSDFDFLVRDILRSRAGDADLDGDFDSSDLVKIFQAGEFEDAIEDNSLWSEGDWNCDGDFLTDDLVAAFKSGGFSNQAQSATGPVNTIDTGSLQLEMPTRSRLAHNDSPRTSRPTVVAPSRRADAVSDPVPGDRRSGIPHLRFFAPRSGTETSHEGGGLRNRRLTPLRKL